MNPSDGHPHSLIEALITEIIAEIPLEDKVRFANLAEDEVQVLEAVLAKFLNYRLEKLDKQTGLKCLAIDGKTLRNSFDNFEDKKPLHLLSVFSSKQRLILGHYEVDSKSNEIPAAQELINELGLSGVIYTLDAMHCQINTFREIKKKQ